MDDFVPDQAISDYAMVALWDEDADLRQILFDQLVTLWQIAASTDGHLGDEALIRDHVLAILGEDYTLEDVAGFAYEFAAHAIAGHATDDELFGQGYAYAEALRQMAAFTQMAAYIDSLREAFQQWNAAREADLLGQLAAAIAIMPETVISVPVGHIRQGFAAFYTAMTAHYQMMLQARTEVEAAAEAFSALRLQAEANRAASDAIMTTAVELIAGTLVEPIDWALSFRDLMEGDPLAALGFLPFFSNAWMRLGRVVDDFFTPRLLALFPEAENFRRRFDPAHLTVDNITRTRQLAQELGIQIHITGRLADTRLETAIRRRATERALELARRNPWLAEALRDVSIDNPVGMNDALSKLSSDLRADWQRIQLDVSNEFGGILSPAQVKVSTGGSEVDVYLEPEVWQQMVDSGQDETFINRLMEIYGVDDVDVYTDIKPKKAGPGWIEAGWSPQNPPPGAIIFYPDGTIIHNELGSSRIVQMKTIMHPDNWVEIPAGECLLGISNQQVERLRQHVDDATSQIFDNGVLNFSHPLRRVWIKQFYIARYPITKNQLRLFKSGKYNARDLPDMLAPTVLADGRIYRPAVAVISDTRLALQLCDELGGRLPTADEWEKAARGTDGQLYPWGDEWDDSRGAFYREGGTKYPEWVVSPQASIEFYPNNLSPYGVWGQVGGLPEMVIVPDEKRAWEKIEWHGHHYLIGLKGCHAKESRRETAFIDHLPARPGVGDWDSMRPVLDVWPQTQWRGVEVSQSDAEKDGESSS